MTTAAASMVNEEVIRRFTKLMACERLAHAYLFVGPSGCGKVETAYAVATLVNCESSSDRPCGSCGSCVKIASGNHPDILFYEQAEELSIKIQKVRELIERIQLRPYEARRKVVIIKNAEALTTEGANALLKTLEEPTASSLLILTTAVPERILDTVKSRCHAVPFFGLSRSALCARLETQDGLLPREAAVLSGYADGCYGKAACLHREEFIALKNEIIEQFVFSGADEAAVKAVTADPEKIRAALNILFVWFKDLLLLQAGADPARLANQDRIQDVRRISTKYTKDQLREILDVIVDTKKMLDANLNVKIPLLLLKEKTCLNS